MGEVYINNWGLLVQSQNAVSSGLNTLHQSEKKEKVNRKVGQTPSQYSKNKTDTQCHRSNAPDPLTLQRRTQVTDPGSVMYMDIAMSPNHQ